MPANKNALIRYKTIDNCLRNRYRRWTLDDLVDACSDALYDMEGISKGVSVRTVQADIQMMRSDKLGYNAPIEVYEHKFYRYADASYSISNMPLSQNDYEVMQEAVDMLRQLEDFDQFTEMSDVVNRLQDHLAIVRNRRKPIVHFDKVTNLKGLRLLNPLYNYIAQRQTLRIIYQSFSAKEPIEYVLCPHLLKEFRNRWFLYGSTANNLTLFNLPLDRIVKVEPSDKPYRDNPNFDPERFHEDVIGVSKNIGDKPKRVVFWADSNQVGYICTKPLHSSQRIEDENPEEGGCVFSINVVVNFELYSVLMSYGPGIKVISPQKVVRHMRNLISKAHWLYNKEEKIQSKKNK